MRTDLDRIVRQALTDAPFPFRRLALEAGVSPALLTLIQQGDRAVTRDVAVKLAAALRQWGARCTHAADAVERAARKVPTSRTRRVPP